MAKPEATHDPTPDAASARNTAQYADQSVTTGAGGEVHQTAGGDTPVLTTQQGIPVADDQNSLRIGARVVTCQRRVRGMAPLPSSLRTCGGPPRRRGGPPCHDPRVASTSEYHPSYRVTATRSP